MGDRPTDSPSVSVEDDNLSSESDVPKTSGKAKAVGTEGHGKPHVPMQKRRRVTRACDECRR